MGSATSKAGIRYSVQHVCNIFTTSFRSSIISLSGSVHTSHEHTIHAGKGHSKGGYRSSHMHGTTNGAASASVEWEFKVIVAGK